MYFLCFGTTHKFVLYIIIVVKHNVWTLNEIIPQKTIDTLSSCTSPTVLVGGITKKIEILPDAISTLERFVLLSQGKYYSRRFCALIEGKTLANQSAFLQENQ